MYLYIHNHTTHICRDDVLVILFAKIKTSSFLIYLFSHQVRYYNTEQNQCEVNATFCHSTLIKFLKKKTTLLLKHTTTQHYETYPCCYVDVDV